LIQACEQQAGRSLGRNELIVNDLSCVSLKIFRPLLYQQPRLPLFSLPYPGGLEGKPAQTGCRNGNQMTSDESTSAEPGGPTPLASNLQAGKFLTVAEVAAILRLSKMSVYRLIHSGQLEAVQFGRSFRVTEKALNTYLEHAYFSAG
jgi:excisionase family DNA binding protein